MAPGSRFTADGRRAFFFNPMFSAKMFEADGICSLTSTETLEEDPTVLRYECTPLTTNYAAIEMGRLGIVRERGFQDAFQKQMLLGCLYVKTWNGQMYPEYLTMIHPIRDMEWPVATGLSAGNSSYYQNTSKYFPSHNLLNRTLANIDNLDKQVLSEY